MLIGAENFQIDKMALGTMRHRETSSVLKQVLFKILPENKRKW